MNRIQIEHNTIDPVLEEHQQTMIRFEEEYAKTTEENNQTTQRIADKAQDMLQLKRDLEVLRQDIEYELKRVEELDVMLEEENETKRGLESEIEANKPKGKQPKPKEKGSK